MVGDKIACIMFWLRVHVLLVVPANVKTLVVTFGGLELLRTKPTVNRVQKLADNTTAGRDLDIYALVVVKIVGRQNLTAIIDEILGYINRIQMTFGAESLLGEEGSATALRAPGYMPSEGTHRVKFVIIGEAGIGFERRREADAWHWTMALTRRRGWCNDSLEKVV